MLPQVLQKKPFILIFLLFVVAFLAVDYYSFKDLIYVQELSHSYSESQIEHYAFSVPSWREPIVALFCAAVLALFVQGLLELRKDQWLSKKLFFAMAALITVLAVVAAPFDSTDISVYINQGWLQLHYGLNPYNATVSMLQNWNHDPMFKEHWVTSPCQYGPLFAVICKIVVMLFCRSYLSCTYGFKILAAACHLGITAMLLWGFDKIKSREDALSSAYLWGLNPYVLMHGVCNGHNDIVLSFMSCLAVFLAFQSRFVLAAFAFVSGILVKYISLAASPFFFLLLFKTASRKVFFASLAVSAVYVLVVAGGYFYSVDPRQFIALAQAYTQSDQASLLNLVKALPLSNARSLVSFGLLAGLAVYYIVRLLRSWQNKDRDKLELASANDIAVSQALIICLISSKFQAWYPLIFIPLALILPETAGYLIRDFAVLASCTLTFSFLWLGFPGASYATIFLCFALLGAVWKFQQRKKD